MIIAATRTARDPKQIACNQNRLIDDMKLYPAVNDQGGPLAPADWTMSIDSEKRGEASYFFADINRDGAPVCRLAITGAFSKEEAQRRLAVKARIWINDYLSRPHSGTTEFGTLE